MEEGSRPPSDPKFPRRRGKRRRFKPIRGPWFTKRPLEKEVRVALVGQPNVGKSVIFNSWTGLGAIVSNYPGTTVELLEGMVYLSYHDVFSPRWHPKIKDWEEIDSQIGEEDQVPEDAIREPEENHNGDFHWRRRRRKFRWKREAPWKGQDVPIRVVDLPGSYSIISPSSDDERVTLRYLQLERPDIIVNVVDATNLPRNLLLTIALLEFNIPMVVCLNQVDLARKMGLNIDADKLAQILGVPVIPTIAIQGKNLKLLLREAAKVALRQVPQKPHRMLFPDGIEAKLKALEAKLAKLNLCPLDLPLRLVSQQLLENNPECSKCIESHSDQEAALTLVETAREELQKEFASDIILVLGERRLDYANYIAEKVQTGKGVRLPLTERISAVLTHPVFGFPIAALIMIGSLLLIFGVGALFEATIGSFWEEIINPVLEGFLTTAIPWPLLQWILYYGLVLGLQGWIFIAVPYVATFYILLALMEDTGYLARVAFLLDGLMHKIGLHGRAIIPLLMGMGCNVPAVLGTRVLHTRKERLIAGFLVVLVPCSAQLAVILGTVAVYGSILFAFVIYGIVLGLIFILGVLLQHTLPGASYGLVMEVPPLRVPKLGLILKKTWLRFKEFVMIALPMIIIGSAILGVLLEMGYLSFVIVPLSPLVVGWLGLPAETAAALIYGILRKELTVELLIVLGGGSLAFMSVRQMFVFALVTTIYIPCIATVAVLVNEYGWKYTIVLIVVTMGLAILFGGLLNALLVTLGIP